MSKKKKSKITSKSPKVSRKKKRENLEWATGFWRNNWMQSIVILVLGIALYLPSISYDYVLDDTIVFVENNYVKKGFDGLSDIFTTDSFEGYFGEKKELLPGSRYRPLSIASFAIEYQILGMNSRASHLINIILYAITCLLLFRILHLLLPKGIDSKTSWLSFAFLTTLLFTIHPLHTEVVANVKGRDEILVFLLAFGAMYYSLKYVYSQKVIWLVISSICFFIGILAKENAVTFAAIIPLAIYLFVSTDLKKIAMATAPLLVTTIIYLMVREGIDVSLFDPPKQTNDLLNNPFVGMDIGERFATIFYTLGWYLKLLFIPHPLTHDYYPYHVPIMSWGDWQSILSFLAYVGMGVLAVMGLKKKSIPAFAILFYLATLSIVSNLVFNIGTFMNERFLYLPSVGFCIFAIWLLFGFLREKIQHQKSLAQWLPLGIFVVISILFITKTITRLPAWESKLSLNEAAIGVSTESTRANCFMGTALFEQYKEDKTKYKDNLDLALTYFEKSLEIHPTYSNSLMMKAGVMAEQFKSNQDIDLLLEGFYDVYTIKHVSYVIEYLEYLNGKPQHVSKLVSFYHKLGYLYFGREMKQYSNAKRFLNYAIEIAPNDPTILKDLCILEYGAQKYNESITLGQRALVSFPKDAELNYFLGKGYQNIGNSVKADELLNQAASLDPKYTRE